MKKNIFLIFTLIIIALSLVLPSFGVEISKSDVSVATSIGVPIFNILLLIIYILVSKYIFKFKFNLGLNKLLASFRNLNIYFWTLTIVPALIVILINIFTAKPINIVLKAVPFGQILLAIFISLFSALITGFFEEITNRGGVLSYFIIIFKKSKHVLLYSTLISSFLFGALHLGNTIIGTAPLEYTLYKVVYAFAMGVSFSLI